MDPLSSFHLDPALVRRIGEIDEFKGRWAAVGELAPEKLARLRRVATVESVGSSTRIEGAILSDEQVDALLEGIELRTFDTRDEQEVAGYGRAMGLLVESWERIPLTENHIKQLHKTLLQYSKKDERHREYKTLPNHVEAFGPDGESLGIVFETTPPLETPARMEQLVGWTSTSLEGDEVHPLLVIAVFVVRFLAIHPFQDGNGRLSRILTTLLLLRAGYDYVPYSSHERVVEENKEEYYRALRRAQSTLDGDESRLGEWIAFFLRCLVVQKDVLRVRVEEVRALQAYPPLSTRVLEYAKRYGRFSVGEAAQGLGVNRNTLKDHLQRLVSSGALARHGRGRASKYELP